MQSKSIISFFTSIIVILFVSLEFTLPVAAETDDEVFYQNCTSRKISGSRIKCVGYPLGCIITKKCVWMGSVIDDGKLLTTNILDKISSVVYGSGGDKTIQYISGTSNIALDDSMTKIVCREPQIEDVIFYFFSNDTSLVGKIDASKDSTSYFKGVTKKATYLENCTETDVPLSKNPKSKFNLRYFLTKHFSGGSTLYYSKTQYEFADSMEYNIDPTKMLYYSKFQDVKSKGTNINLVTTKSILLLCFIAQFYST